MDGNQSNDPVFPEDFPYPEGQTPPIRRFKWIAPGYFETMGRGWWRAACSRGADLERAAPVAIVSENLAREHWKEPAKAVGRASGRARRTPGAKSSAWSPTSATTA